MTIKRVEARVRSETNRVEIALGLPGSPGTNGTDGEDGADGVSITGASIDGSGHLILTLSVGGPIDVGLVVGADGADGADGTDGVSITGASVDGSGHLILTLSTGGTVDAGLVVGSDGVDGEDGTDGTDGVSITGASIDGSYHLILTLSSGGPIDAGYVRGPAGADGTGTGDVLGVAPSIAGNFARYTDTTGKEIEDSGVGPDDFASAAEGALAASAVQPGDLGTAAALDTGVGAGNIPVLDGSGLLDTSILPAVAITDVFVVADQTAMLALTAQRGDIAVRTDLNKSFALSTNSPTTLADWKELLTPTDAVLSVAGLTGAISASGLRTALTLVVGTNVQAWSTHLDNVAALSKTDGNFIVANGTTFVAEGGATARASIGLGNVDNTSNATERAAVATLTNKTINASNNTISNLTTAMFATNVVDTDEALTANSDTRIPSQQAVKAYVDAAGGGGAVVQISKQTVPAGGVSQVVFNNIPSSGYSKFILVGIDVTSEIASTSGVMFVQVSTDNGSTFKTTSGDYYSSGASAFVFLTRATVPGANSTYKRGIFTLELVGLGNANRATSGYKIANHNALSVTNVATSVPAAGDGAMRVVVETDNAFRCVASSGDDIGEGSTFILYGVTET